MLAGTEVAHALAYRIVYPVASVRWHVLAASGHGYLGYGPLVLGLAAATVLAAFASTVADVVQGRPTRPLPAWTFGALPPVGFTVQEFTERLFATHTLPWWMVEQPTFRIGLLLQVPFALLAYIAARLLLRVAERAGEALGGARLPIAAFGELIGWHAFELTPSRVSAIVGGHAVRGPPQAASRSASALSRVPA
jgi:hypothetical protein